MINGFKIKNIIWDVDGTLVDLNKSYYDFLTQHYLFKDIYKDLKYKDLDKVLPVEKLKYGAMELKNHPTLGQKLDEEFCNNDKFYFNRRLYKNTEEVLLNLNKLGYKQFILSAGFNEEKKKKLLNNLFSKFDFITIEVVEHDKNGMHEGNSKEMKIKNLLEKYNLIPQETILVDDRIYNIQSALNAGIKAIRFRSEFTTETPKKLKVPEVFNIKEFEKWVVNYNNNI